MKSYPKFDILFVKSENWILTFSLICKWSYWIGHELHDLDINMNIDEYFILNIKPEYPDFPQYNFTVNFQIWKQIEWI